MENIDIKDTNEDEEKKAIKENEENVDIKGSKENEECL